MSEESLAVETREGTGKGAARKMRDSGRVPGIVYGGGHEARSVSLDPKALQRIIDTNHSGINALIDLEGGEGLAGRTVMVKDLQREAVRGAILHADLFEVDLKARVQVSVPIILVGSPEGVQMGGLLDHALHRIDVSCMPDSIPDDITIDVSALDLGDSIHVHEITLPEGVDMVTPSDLPVAAVVIPRGITEEEEAAAAAEAEAEAEGEAAEGEAGDEKASESGGDKAD